MFRAKNIRVNLKKIFRLRGHMYEQVVVILHQTSIEFHDHPINTTLWMCYVVVSI